MVLSYKFRSLCFAFLLMGCVDGERDNPYDPDGINYNPNAFVVSQSGSPVTYEGETYQTVVIGNQTWFASNLNYAPSSGTFISCYTYDCATYGRLYDWETAMTVCPSGWHLPSQAEWNVLGDDARKLKATSGWYNNDSDIGYYGFSALPGGYGNSDGSFYGVGTDGYWWSASEYNSNDAYYRDMYYNGDFACWYHDSKYYLFSVRCVKD